MDEDKLRWVMTIKTIIFDAGGVLTIGSFYNSLGELLESELKIPKERIVKSFKENDEKFIRGKEDKEDFWKKISLELGLDYNIKAFNKCFLTAFKFNKNVLEVVKKLKKNYKLILFSDNFNGLSDFTKKTLKEYFDLMYFSNKMGLTKEDRKPFEIILKENNLRSSECLFIDDKERNASIAKSFGINSIVFNNIEQLKCDLKSYNVTF